MGIVIRDAREDEHAQIGALLQECYRQYLVYAADEPAWKDYFENDIPDVSSRLADSELIVAVVDGEIQGTVTYYPPGRAGVEGWDDGVAAIRLLGVHPRARGRSLGRLLTEECISRARAHGAGALGLHNHHAMDVARALYIRMGFEHYPQNDFSPSPDTVVEAFILRAL